MQILSSQNKAVNLTSQLVILKINCQIVIVNQFYYVFNMHFLTQFIFNIKKLKSMWSVERIVNLIVKD